MRRCCADVFAGVQGLDWATTHGFTRYAAHAKILHTRSRRGVALTQSGNGGRPDHTGEMGTPPRPRLF